MKKHWRGLPLFAPPPAADDRLAITAMKAWRVKEPAGGRRYTVVRLQTRGGLVGFGEGGPAHAPEINEARTAIVGRTATDAEFVRHQFAEMPAMEAAINNAMLDVMGRATNAPVYQYLGGPTRFKTRLLAHIEGEGEDAMAENARRAKSQGFRAFTVPIPSRDSMWKMQAYVDAIKKRVDRVREAAGAECDFVLDAHGSLTPGDAGFIATALERQHLVFMDEPTSVLTNDALVKVTEESVMPMGIGRNVTEISTFQNLLRWGCVDILRPSVGLNSILKIRRMSAIAETHYVAVGPHHSGGPIGTIAAIHMAASLPNFFIQHVPQPAAEQDRAMRAELTSGNQETATDGFAKLLNKPGMGIEVSEAALTKYSEEVL